MKQLINGIKNNIKVHYLYGYPAKERDKMVRVIKKEFKSDVKIVSGAVPWSLIKRYKERIKVITSTDKIIELSRLGEDFKEMLQDGSIYLFFTRNKIKDSTLKYHWYNFFKHLDKPMKYSFEKKEPEKKTTGSIPAYNPATIRRRKIVSIIIFILFTLLMVSFFFKLLKQQPIGLFHLLLLYIFHILGFLNLFFGESVSSLLKNKVEPFFLDLLERLGSRKYNKEQ